MRRISIRFIIFLVLLLVALFILHTNFTVDTKSANTPGLDWQTATPAESGFDPVLFANALNNLPAPALVIRHGKIVGQKGDITRTGLLWSASKSLVAISTARQIQLNNITYDTVVPTSDATYRQFLSMTSDYGLTPHQPGAHYAYNNGAVAFYSERLRDSFFAGQNNADFFKNSLNNALQFQDAVTFPSTTWAGVNYMSGWNGGWQMSTRDLARIGLLVLQNGNWNGQQIIPASFVSNLYTNQIPANATPSNFSSDIFYNQPEVTVLMPNAYSFGFWITQNMPVNDINHTRNEAIKMWGKYGTAVYISRQKDLLVVTANPGGQSDESDAATLSGAEFDAVADSITDVVATTRVAISSDGNNHDCDDILASAMSVALLSRSGNGAKLVYYGHSDHVWWSNVTETCASFVTDREQEMQTSTYGAAQLFGSIDLNVFINARSQTDAAILKLVDQINISSGTNRLLIVAAGPMEVIGRALQLSGPNRQFVSVVSHSAWNDNHADTPENEPFHTGWTWSEMQTSFPTVQFTKIPDQNTLLTTDASRYTWLRDSSDSKLQWLWQRYITTGKFSFDPSDAGMVYWFITGDNAATPEKLRAILDTQAATPTPTPTPVATATPTPTPNVVTFVYQLVAAPSGSLVQTLINGSVVNLAALPTRSLAISVIPSNTVGSVRINHNGLVRIENVAPYASAGDTSGAFNADNFNVGTHTINVNAFSGVDGTGNVLGSESISFTVVDQSSTPTPTPTPIPTPSPTATPTPTPVATPTPSPSPTCTRLPNGKCPRGCICIN